MTTHPDCADRCQLMHHKGYDTCAQSGRCDMLPRPQGRPRIVPADGKRITITLNAASYEKARNLGAGNISAGIRIAVERGLQVSAQLEPQPEDVPDAI